MVLFGVLGVTCIVEGALVGDVLLVLGDAVLVGKIVAQLRRECFLDPRVEPEDDAIWGLRMTHLGVLGCRFWGPRMTHLGPKDDAFGVL